ncbi:MAG TPA: hypothetical protein VFB96_25625 [Pirellulaceae bacterium]|nr:hypothetical protein [Pirellulaceae bacterium]
MSNRNETINPYELPPTCLSKPAIPDRPKRPLVLWFVFFPTTLFSLLSFLYVTGSVGLACYVSLHKDQFPGVYGIDDYFASRLPGDWMFIPLCIFAFTISLTQLVATPRSFLLFKPRANTIAIISWMVTSVVWVVLIIAFPIRTNWSRPELPAAIAVFSLMALLPIGVVAAHWQWGRIMRRHADATQAEMGR